MPKGSWDACTSHRIATFLLAVFTAQLLLKPAPDALAIVSANGRGDVVGKTAQALTQRHDSSALALATAVE